jgi:antitoxin HicB
MSQGGRAMKTIFYPAIFKQEASGYSVSLPDLPGCFTQGESMEEAAEMAFDAIGLFLEDVNPDEYPNPSPATQIKTGKKEVMVLIPFNPVDYEKKWNTRAIRKSLTLPAWLNRLAEEKHVNYSHVLQEALKKELKISEDK